MCCLYGIIDYEHRQSSKSLAYITSVLSKECEVRGMDATGIAYAKHGNISIYKRPKPAHSMKFFIPNNCHVIMGHTRMTTQGNEKYNKNNHPFIGHCENTPFALAHNGVIHNDKQLRRKEKLPKTLIETDSYIAVQLIEKRNILDFDSLKYIAEKVNGTFSFTILDKQNNLYFIKGDNPLCIYKFSTLGFYLYASTVEILRKAVVRLGLEDYKYEEVKITSGEIIRVNSNGTQQRANFKFDSFAELGYFNRCLQSYHSKCYEQEHWSELKSVANYFGCNQDDIEHLKNIGYSPVEVEELLYSGEVFCNSGFGETEEAGLNNDRF